MNISASISNSNQEHAVTVSTGGDVKTISIQAKAQGKGSSINGGELLFAALATCFCNDIYREAAKRKMDIHSIDVTVDGKFGKEGEPGSEINYKALVIAPEHSQEEINDLIHYVDRIAEIHNTLRKGTSVTLKH